MANIESTAELNKLLKEQNKIFQVQAKVLRGQLQVMKAMAETMAKMPAEKISQSFDEMDKAIKSADGALKEFTNEGQARLGKMTGEVKKGQMAFTDLGDKSIKLGKKLMGIGAVVTIFESLNAGLRAGAGLIKSMISVASTLAKTFLSVGVSILTAPLKMLNALMQEAQSFNGTAFMQAIQDVKKAFGDLSKNEGRAIIKSFRNIRGELANTGLSSRRILGNMAQRLDFVRTTAEALGRTFTALRDGLEENIEAAAAYVKGLGLSQDGIKALGKAALASGKDFTEIGRQITTMAYGLGETFKINGKLISRDISEMIGDFQNFGSIGIKQMSQIAVYTRKLGIEIKDLLGVIGKFDDFETAAQSAAQLSQAFGIQIDALEMLKEQDPAARFESLRKAFLSTGKSVEKLSRQELSLLSQQTGLSAEALKLGFSHEKMGMSYEEVQKQAAATEKKQLTQAEAMEKLSKSIERLVKQGQQMRGGFFDIFLQGFERGIRWTREFWGLMWNLRRAMRIVYWEGRRVGQMFVHEFPGVKDVLGGLRDLFKPKAWRKMMGGVRQIFADFFKDLKSGKRFSLETMIEAFRKNFFNWFDVKQATGKRVLEGFKTFFLTLGKIGAEVLRIGMKGLTASIRTIIDLIRDPGKVLRATKGPAGQFIGFIRDIFEPAWDAIREQWPFLKKALEDLWVEVKPIIMKWFDKAKDFLWEVLKTSLKWTLVSRLIVTAGLSAITVAAGKLTEKGVPILGKALGKIFGKASKSPAVSREAGQISAGISGLARVAGQMTTGPAGKVNWTAIRTMAAKMAVGIAAIAALSTVMALNFVLIRKILGKVEPKEIKSILKAIGGMGLLYLESAGIILTSVATGGLLTIPGIAPVALIGFAALAGVVTAMTGHALAIIKTIDKMSFSTAIAGKVDTFLKVVNSMVTVANSMANIMKLAKPSFKTLFLGNADEEFRKNLDAVKKLIQAIGTQIQHIIFDLNKIVRKLKPNQFKGIEVFSELLGATASLVQALIPPKELTGSFFEKLIGIDTLGAISSYMLRTVDVISQLIPTMQKMMKKISKMPDIKSESISTFVNFMQGIGGLIQALTPSADLLNTLRNSGKVSVAWGLFEEEISKGTNLDAVVKSVTNFMGKIIGAMLGKGGALEKIKKFMTGMVKQISAIGDPAKINAAANLFGTSLSSITNLLGLLSPDKIKDFKAASTTDLDPLFAGFNTNILIPLNKHLPLMSGGLKELATDIQKIDKVFTSKVGSGLSDMITKINSISTQLNKLKLKKIKTQLRQTSDKLGLKGNEQLKVNLNDLNIIINVGVTVDADEFEQALTSRPGGSQFVIKGK